MNKIDGKYAIVTGGTQGLGAAIAMQFAKAGATGIITCGRNRDKGEAVALKIQSETGCVLLVIYPEG
ncbi:MAG: SDR family NAD(P)-dependent oxidoreductase [Porticoccus sp.]|nr:SDR family NAD(P)-dependent oxidoreductase [Porticoccus sp.]